jgi:prepilin-type N-terminal cleavage/methylation domain-containing protein
MNTRATLRDTRGMTLIELLVATTIALVVLTISLGFFNSQAQSLRAGTSQFGLTQNYRLALGTLASQLRATGSNLSTGQPFLLFAGPDAVAFNADWVTDDPNNPFAVSVDTAAPRSEIEALTAADKFTLPGTTLLYPLTTYTTKGVNSGAETLIFYFAADTTTPRSDDFALFRQVNRGSPAVVARNILRTPGVPFFEYLYPLTAANGTISVQTYSGAALAHTAAVHGSEADAKALIDEVRGVRVNLTATDGTTGARERKRSVSRTILLPNAGVTPLESCGEAPQLGTSLSATPSAPGDPPQVTLRWTAAIDETAGEKDVLRYVIWKRTPAGDWGPPELSIPAGMASYSYVDTQVQAGGSYGYALAAQDCTPLISTQSLASVTLPTPP